MQTKGKKNHTPPKYARVCMWEGTAALQNAVGQNDNDLLQCVFIPVITNSTAILAEKKLLFSTSRWIGFSVTLN